MACSEIFREMLHGHWEPRIFTQYQCYWRRLVWGTYDEMIIPGWIALTQYCRSYQCPNLCDKKNLHCVDSFSMKLCISSVRELADNDWDCGLFAHLVLTIKKQYVVRVKRNGVAQSTWHHTFTIFAVINSYIPVFIKFNFDSICHKGKPVCLSGNKHPTSTCRHSVYLYLSSSGHINHYHRIKLCTIIIAQSSSLFIICRTSVIYQKHKARYWIDLQRKSKTVENGHSACWMVTSKSADGNDSKWLPYLSCYNFRNYFWTLPHNKRTPM